MGVTATIITYNEEELLPGCLEYLDSLHNLQEICIIDSFSTDKTWKILKNFKTDKMYKIKQQEFRNFGEQKNKCISMASQKWILMIDADETYSYQMDKLLGDLNERKLDMYNAIRFFTFMTYPNKKHFIRGLHPDPHIRIWRRGLFKYYGECHEELYDKCMGNIHRLYSGEILNAYSKNEYKYIYLLHHQRLKSMKSLAEKGERWSEFDMLKKSGERGLPVNKVSWMKLKQEAAAKRSTLLPYQYWDHKE